MTDEAQERDKFVRYHITSGTAFMVEEAPPGKERGIVGPGWLAIQEEEYALLLTDSRTIATLTDRLDKMDSALEDARDTLDDVYARTGDSEALAGKNCADLALQSDRTNHE